MSGGVPRFIWIFSGTIFFCTSLCQIHCDSCCGHRARFTWIIITGWSINKSFSLQLDKVWIFLPALDVIFQFIRLSKGSYMVLVYFFCLLLCLGFVPSISCELSLCGEKLLHFCTIWCCALIWISCYPLSTKEIKHLRCHIGWGFTLPLGIGLQIGLILT